MQPGQLCRLRGLEDWVWRPPRRRSQSAHKQPEEWLVPLVLGIIVSVQPHTEDASRLLFFFRPIQVVLLWARSEAGAETPTDAPTHAKSEDGGSSSGGGAPAAQRVRYRRYYPPSSATDASSTGGKGDLHRRSDLHMGPHSFSSADGYAYKHDGWYDVDDLEPVTDDVVQARYGVSVRRVASDILTTASSSSSTVNTAAASCAVVLPQSWVAAMDATSACCEVRYLCYAFRPWFSSAFASLAHVALPERQLCYSVHLCHRCLTPFLSLEQLLVHLDGYCLHGRRPPGPLLYHDHETGRKVYFVDGAQHLHYGRCLSLLGKGFIESKLIQNDVDIYEFFVVTIPRQTAPFVASSHETISADTAPQSSSSDADSNNERNEDEKEATRESHHRIPRDPHVSSRPPSGCGNDNDTQSTAHAFRAFVGSYDAAAWDGDVVVGYFSRLKHQPHHALSCIMTLPCFQRMQLGTFMLDAAYAFAQERQVQCGCVRWCGAPESDGAAISRPFSPHGQALLLAYWRRALLLCLWQRHQQQHQQQVKREPVEDQGQAAARPDSGPIAESFAQLRQWLPIPISLVDLEFLCLHSDFAFYAPTARKTGATAGAESSGSGSGSSSRRRMLSLSTATSAAAAMTPPAHDFTGSLVFDINEVRDAVEVKTEPHAAHAMPGALPGSFDRKWLRRLSGGQLAYNETLFHH